MSDSKRSVSSGALGRTNMILVRILEILAILAMGTLVLDVVWGVMTRYLIGEQAKWTEELARFLLIWVSMLGGALAFRRREHLGIDFLIGLTDTAANVGVHQSDQEINPQMLATTKRQRTAKHRNPDQ